MQKLEPGRVRDGIEQFFHRQADATGASAEEIALYIESVLGAEVARSSVRSYLRLNTPNKFERVARGKYRLVRENA